MKHARKENGHERGFMQAVIRTGGNQYMVKVGQTLEVDLLGDAKKVELDALLTIDGDKVVVGAPFVSGVKIVAEVLGETKGDKIKVLKFKPKKRVKKLTGHRQHYSQIKIVSIGEVKDRSTSLTAGKKAEAKAETKADTSTPLSTGKPATKEPAKSAA
jgi:large subunit ribosomal protein L21